MLLNTMLEVFPDTTVWSNKWAWWFNGRNSAPDTGCRIDYEVTQRMFSDPNVARDMTRVGSHIADMFSNIVASPKMARQQSLGMRVIEDDHTYVDFLVPRLENTAAFGGGVGYYTAPLKDLFRSAWTAAGRVDPWLADPWVGNSFHLEPEVETGGAAAVDDCLAEFPADLRESVKQLQPSALRGRAGYRPPVLPKSLRRQSD